MQRCDLPYNACSGRVPQHDSVIAVRAPGSLCRALSTEEGAGGRAADADCAAGGERRATRECVAQRAGCAVDVLIQLPASNHLLTEGVSQADRGGM
jgi:hypothetical protein